MSNRDRPESADGDLRAGFAALTEAREQGRDCPPTAPLWDSAGDRLSPGEDRELILHLGECGACATSWRLAREMEPGAGAKAPTEATSPALRRRWLPLAAAAALVVVAGGVALLRLPERVDTTPVYRVQEESWLGSELPADRPLPRHEALLRWTTGPEGTRYDLRVTTEDLEPLARAVRIEVSEFLVPPGKIEELPEGAAILWRVTAHLPDGRQTHSRSFVTRLE